MVSLKWYEWVIFIELFFVYFTWAYSRHAIEYTLESSVYCEVYCCAKNFYENQFLQNINNLDMPSYCDPRGK